MSAHAAHRRNTSLFEEEFAKYDYTLPPELIANAPAVPRDSARLVVAKQTTNEYAWDTFAHIAHYLPQNAVLVMNQTKVIPARLPLKRSTGGKVEVLYLATRDDRIVVLANRTLELGEKLVLANGAYFSVQARDGKSWLLKPSFPLAELPQIFEDFGKTPIPPYIKHCPLSERELRREYQTVFAKEAGSVAAPTASLHFTPELLRSIAARGITLAYVTLHVNLGTFAPLTDAQMIAEKLHEEWYEIDINTAALISDAKAAGRPIIAVGTTAVRTLESACDTHGNITKPRGTTDLFIREGYTFKMVSGMITNFHVPRSSLMMLVAAFIGRERLLHLYAQAIEKKCRFYSFGDGMLLL